MENQTEIDCGSVLDIAGIEHWWELAHGALQTGSPLRLKADELQRVDAAGLQAILCLFLTAQHRDIAIQWDKPSPVLNQAARLIGLDEMLKLA